MLKSILLKLYSVYTAFTSVASMVTEKVQSVNYTHAEWKKVRVTGCMMLNHCEPNFLTRLILQHHKIVTLVHDEQILQQARSNRYLSFGGNCSASRAESSELRDAFLASLHAL